MLRSAQYWWFGLMLAGCGFDLSLMAPRDGSASADDANLTDAEQTADGAIDGPSTTFDAVPLVLVDRGIVARYFIDEASSGQSVASLVDSAPMPQSVPITYGQITYVEDNGNRGLRWAASQSTGKIEAMLGTSKLRMRLTTTPTITIEVVVQITASGTAGTESQITGLRGSNPDFMLTSLNTTDLRFFRPYGSEGATWTNANPQQRMVLHLVYDSTRQSAAERIELFRNGTHIPKTTGSAPLMGQLAGLGSSDDFLIGNRQGSDRSLGGTIYYVAYYDVALSTTEITTNAQRLLANDDL